jgi:hypothetical protein
MEQRYAVGRDLAILRSGQRHSIWNVAQQEMDSAGATPVWVAPGNTIGERQSTVCVSNNVTADAIFSCVIRSICCAVLGENTSVLQLFTYARNLYRKT